MFGHSTSGLAAQMLPLFEMLERRYCFSTAVSVQSASFADPTPFEDELSVAGVNTSNFVWGVDKETGGGSGLKFDGVAAEAEVNEFFSIGNLVFHNVGTIGGEAASVNLVLTLKIDGKVQTIMVPLGIDNTINTDDPLESRDSVFLDAGPIVGDVFENVAGERLAVVILGFKADAQTTIGEAFFADEESEVSTHVIAGLVPEQMLDSQWLRSSDVQAWQAGQNDSQDDSDDNSDDSGDSVIEDNADNGWQDDMGDEAWNIDLGN